MLSKAPEHIDFCLKPQGLFKPRVLCVCTRYMYPVAYFHIFWDKIAPEAYLGENDTYSNVTPNLGAYLLGAATHPSPVRN